MEAKLTRASPLIVLIGSLPVRFSGSYLTSAFRLAAFVGIAFLLMPRDAAAQEATDPLNQHYSAAQTFQLGGDLDRAEAEYHQVLALALHRMGTLVDAEKNDSEEA